jgi:hypothetical protein
MPIVPEPVRVRPQEGRPCLTLDDVEAWCVEMRQRGATGAAPVHGRVKGFRAWLRELSAVPQEGGGDDGPAGAGPAALG